MSHPPDETSAALYNGVRRVLAHRGILVDAPPSVRGEARVDHTSKRTLLEVAVDHGGPGLVLSLGQSLMSATSDPAVAVLRRAASPADAVRRWQRLERFYHSRHRTVVVASGEGQLRARHVASRGAAPAELEDLLIAGIFLALIEASGATRTHARFGDGVPFADAGAPCLERLGETRQSGTWSFEWARIASSESVAAETPPKDTASLEARLRSTFATDPARAWTVSELARSCGMSARTLQRRLEHLGTPARTLLRDLRARHAARLLAETDDTLAQVGFASGFSDQAHFGREFKRCIGMPPGRYREML